MSLSGTSVTIDVTSPLLSAAGDSACLTMCDTHTSEKSLSVKAGVKRLRRPMIWRKEGERLDRGEL